MAREIDSEWGSLERQILDITINAPLAQQQALRETVQTLRREYNRNPPPSASPVSPGTKSVRHQVWDTETRAVEYHHRCAQVDTDLMQSRANRARLAKEQDDLQAKLDAMRKERAEIEAETLASIQVSVELREHITIAATQLLEEETRGMSLAQRVQQVLEHARKSQQPGQDTKPNTPESSVAHGRGTYVKIKYEIK